VLHVQVDAGPNGPGQRIDSASPFTSANGFAGVGPRGRFLSVVADSVSGMDQTAAAAAPSGAPAMAVELAGMLALSSP
jgi:hypothetical protein